MGRHLQEPAPAPLALEPPEESNLPVTPVGGETLIIGQLVILYAEDKLQERVSWAHKNMESVMSTPVATEDRSQRSPPPYRL